MDICIHIPKIPFKITINQSINYNISDICSQTYMNNSFLTINKNNNFLHSVKEKYQNILLPFLNYDYLNYEIFCNHKYIHRLYYNLHYKNNTCDIILNDREKYLFENLYKLSSTNNSRNKKIIVLYNLSKYLSSDGTVNKDYILYITFLFEIFPVRMNLVYYLLYSNTNLEFNKNIVEKVENIILTKFPYKEMIQINKRDLNINLFQNTIDNLKINKHIFFQCLPYILNINYSLKTNLESYL